MVVCDSYLCPMNYLTVLELTGTYFFALSGALTAANKRFDILGMGIIAFVTALGGGTLRDLLIGIQPVGWMTNIVFLILPLMAVATAFLFKKQLEPLRKTFFLFDATGLAVFSIGGMEKALALNIHPAYAVMLGMISATMGGVVRDTLCKEVPLIFRREIYASACIIGASVYYLLSLTTIDKTASVIFTILLVIGIRILAVKFKIGLPRAEA